MSRASETISGRLTFRYKSNLLIREIEGLVRAGVEIVGVRKGGFWLWHESSSYYREGGSRVVHSVVNLSPRGSEWH